MPLLTLQAITISMQRWVAAQRHQVKEAQIKSGFHYYRDAMLQSGSYAEDIDFGKLSANVCGVAANMATSELCLRGLSDLAASILEQNTLFICGQTAINKDEAERASHHIERNVRFWAKECDFMLQGIVSWQHKASIVIQGLFNLIAQRDQKTNIAIARDSKILAEQSQKIAYESRMIAEESKRDSTSMKAIAAVTICFLPGTFVAVSHADPNF